MCASGHLAPGAESSELSRGLEPQPPNLSKDNVDAAHAFWVIKHGVKASGMPAWGKRMDDESIGNLVAFLQKLPQMDDPQYDRTVGSSGGHALQLDPAWLVAYLPDVAGFIDTPVHAWVAAPGAMAGATSPGTAPRGAGSRRSAPAGRAP